MPDDMRVVILGAGASHGASIPGEVLPPLVNQFFAVADHLGLLREDYGKEALDRLRAEIERTGGDFARAQEAVGVPEFMGHLFALKEFVKEQLDVKPDEYQTTGVDIERLMALAEGELLGRHAVARLTGPRRDRPVPTAADKLEEHLHFVICGALLGTTRDAVCEYHVALAEWLRPGDVVLSFNYDLLIDRALKRRGDWFINDGYGLSFHKVGGRGAWRSPLGTVSRVKLLKLHGSLNWLHCRDSWQSNMNMDLRGLPYRSAPQLLYCLDDLYPTFEEDHPLYEWWARYEHEQDEYIFDLHSLIVPPTLSKAYRSFEPLIGDIWGMAIVALLRATELYLIGYSIRPEDARCQWLLKKCAVEGKVANVNVVDPSEETLRRAVEMFGEKRTVRAASTIQGFAKMLR